MLLPGRVVWSAAGCALLVAIGGCSESLPTDDGAREEQPALKLACVDPDDNHCRPPEGDPDPNAPGYYLEGISWTPCLAGSLWGDADRDGLDDKCEYEIAKAFAPLLITSPDDTALGREPHWAATYQPAGYAYPGSPKQVRVIYMLSYFLDPGVLAPRFGWPPIASDGHRGDSEFIVLWVVFDGGHNESFHWLLSEAFLSAHWRGPSDSSERVSFDQLFFDGNIAQRNPMVWVSKTKHANYRSPSMCEGGSIADHDTCAGNTPEARREVVRSSRNVGSRARKLRNCVSSRSGPGIECYWNNNDFCGWYDRDGAVCSGPYRRALDEFGF